MKHQEMFGNAKWIGCDGTTVSPYIRNSFMASENAKGKIIICGLGYFELYINGKRISDDLFVPVTSDYVKRSITVSGKPFDEEMAHRCYVLEYDITRELVAGQNQLAVALGPGFFASTTEAFDGPVSYGEVRLCYRILLSDEDGKQTEVFSGEQDKWIQGDIVQCDFFTGESVDLRMHCENWTVADYDNWNSVRILPNMDTEYQIQDCPGDKISRYLIPRLIGTYAGRKIYDAGENVTGWVVLKDNSKPNEKVKVGFSENLGHDGLLDPLYMHWQSFEVISDGKGRCVHPRFTWNAFRYFSVSGEADVMHVAVIHSDVSMRSSFKSPHPVLNWIHDTFVHTMLCNMHGGIPSDCPHLERRGYTGDGQLTMEAALLSLNHHDFVRKWMRDIADCQDRKSGHVQYTAPYTRCGGGPGGWGSAIVSVPYRYYKHYGETAPLEEMYSGMCRYIEYLKNHSVNDLVISDREGEWCLGDWCCPGGMKIPEPFVNNYFMIKSIDMMQEIAGVLKMMPEARLNEYRKQAVDAIIRTYYDSETGNFADNVQGANAFMVDIGLGDERTLKNMVEHYEAIGCYDTGIFGTEIVTRVLFEKGYADIAYKLLTSEADTSFAGWMKHGATTLWEYWIGDEQRSLSHPMFGAVVNCFYWYILGIRQKNGTAGYRDVTISPKLIHLLPSLSGSLNTQHGNVSVKYSVMGDRVEWQIAVPEGVEACLSVGEIVKELTPGNHIFATDYHKTV